MFYFLSLLFDFGKGSWLLDKGKEKGLFFDGSYCDSGVYSRQRGREAVEFVANAFSLSLLRNQMKHAVGWNFALFK